MILMPTMTYQGILPKLPSSHSIVFLLLVVEVPIQVGLVPVCECVFSTVKNYTKNTYAHTQINFTKHTNL